MIETLQLWIRKYPNDFNSLVNISVAYIVIGNYEKAIEYTRRAIAIQPDDVIAQENLIQDLIVLNRMQEARDRLAKVNEMKLGESTEVLQYGYLLAALDGNTAEMDRLVQQVTGRADGYILITAKATFEEYEGRYRTAEQTWQEIADLTAAQKANDAEAGAILSLVSGRGFADMCQDSESRIKRALALDKTKPTLRQAGFTAAICGNKKIAEPILNDLDKKYPEDTTIQGITLPESRALLDLADRRPADAIAELEKAKAYDLASTGAYLRGIAYLAAHDAGNAIIALQSATDQRGAALAQGYQTFPQAQLGLARAYVMTGDKAKARAAYQAFFDQWKNADPDLPQLIAAKKEFAAL